MGIGFKRPGQYSTYLLHREGVTYVGITQAWRYKMRIGEHRRWWHAHACSCKIFEGVFTHCILETKWCETVEEYKAHERLSMSYFTHTNCNIEKPGRTDDEILEAHRLTQKRRNKKFRSKPGVKEQEAKDQKARRKAKTNHVVEQEQRKLRTRGFECNRQLVKLMADLLCPVAE
tara:strand:+ start:57 stop:578 length:522 start_codon:yes stop_codon:yes gene_type:complete